MEFTIPPQLLLVIASGIILLSALVTRVIRDAGAISRANGLNRQLIKTGRSRLKTGVSVIIELHKKADTILPLLDHLYGQSYPKLEVIVVIKQTAGKNARPTLARYKRAHPGIELRLTSYKAGVTSLGTVRRYATKPLVMTLSAGQRLSPHFFSLISVDYALEHPDRIIPGRYGMLDNTLGTAIASHAILLNSKSVEASSPLTIIPGIVYKRTSLLRPPKTEHSLVSQSAYVLAPAVSVKPSISGGLTTPRVTWLKLLLAIIVISGLTYVGLSVSSFDRFVLLGLIVGVFVFMYATTLVGLKAYSTVDKLSLVLLSPVFMIYRGISYVRATTLALIRTPKRVYGFSKNLLSRKKYA